VRIGAGIICRKVQVAGLLADVAGVQADRTAAIRCGLLPKIRQRIIDNPDVHRGIGGETLAR
jgi:hypothetical protein